jgi:hypothetical protein
VAAHGFWIMVCIPLVWWAAVRLPPCQLRLFGGLAMTLAALAAAVIVGHDLRSWYPSAPADIQAYVHRRMLLTVAKAVEVPVVQLWVAGLVCWVLGRRRER